jgi:hypothetical protein
MQGSPLRDRRCRKTWRPVLPPRAFRHAPEKRWLAGARVAFAAALIACAAGSARAIEIKTEVGSDDKAITLRLSGAFEPGDGLKMRAFVANLPPEASIAVNFDATGGSFAEAMSIGRFLHQIGAATIVPANAKCLSPCPLAFLAGADTSGASARTKHSSARLGFTAFQAGAKERDYTWKEMAEALATTQQGILQVLDYLYEVGANTDVLGRFYDNIPANQVRYISDDDLLFLGVSIFDDKANQLIDAKALQKRLHR